MSFVTSWILARIVEPSTWGGIGKLIGGLAFLPHAEQFGALIPTLGILVTGVVQIFMADPGSK